LVARKNAQRCWLGWSSSFYDKLNNTGRGSKEGKLAASGRWIYYTKNKKGHLGDLPGRQGRRTYTPKIDFSSIPKCRKPCQRADKLVKDIARFFVECAILRPAELEQWQRFFGLFEGYYFEAA